MIAYRLRLIALPEGGGGLVLNLHPWQQQALDDLLTDRQRQMLDDGLIGYLTHYLVEEIEEALS